MKKLIVLLLLLFALPVASQAKIPEPTIIIYGSVTIGTTVITQVDTNIIVKAMVGTSEIDSYAMGSVTEVNDDYILQLPMDSLGTRTAGTVRAGDLIKLFVEGIEVDSFTLDDRGLIQQRNLTLNATDSDNDGMPDFWENKYAQLNPAIDDAQGDIDLDGLTNLQEYLTNNDPTVADTDGDGMSDGYEVANGLDTTTNDAALDPDGDGLTNLQEFQANTNPNSTDSDGDGINDDFEIANGLNPNFNDANLDLDGDGYTNLEEYINNTNPATSDTPAVQVLNQDASTDAHQSTSVIQIKAYGTDKFVTAGYRDFNLKVWDLNTNAVLKTIPTGLNQTSDNGLNSLAVYNDQAFVGTGSGRIQVWDLSQSTPTKDLEITTASSVLAILLHNDQIVTGFADGMVNIYNKNDGSFVRSFQAQDGFISSIAVYENQASGQTLLYAQETFPNNDTEAYNFDDGEFIIKLTGEGSTCCSLNKSYLLEDQLVLTGQASSQNVIKVFNLKTYSAQSVQTSFSQVSALSGQNDKVIVGSDQGNIELWNVTFNRLIDSKSAHATEVSATLLIGNRIVTGSVNGDVKIWTLQTL